MSNNVPNTPTLLAASYSRVSTVDQVSSSKAIKVSLAQQADLASAFAEKQGWQLLKDYQEPGVSGEEIERPALQSLLADARSHKFHYLIVRHSDRLARANYIYQYVVHTLEQECLVQIVDLNDPSPLVPPASFDPRKDSGRAVRHGIKGLFTEYDNKSKTALLTAAKERLAHQGKILPSVAPYGYRKVWVEASSSNEATTENRPRRSLEPVPAQQADLKYIRNLFLEEGLTVNMICSRLEKEGVPKPSGGKYWSPSTLKRILLNPFYGGVIAYRQTVVKPGAKGVQIRNPRPDTIINAPHNFPTPWTWDDHLRIVAKLAEVVPSRAKGLGNPFSPTLRCGYCGNTMALSRTRDFWRKNNWGMDYWRFYYVCGYYLKNKQAKLCRPNRVPFTVVAGAIFDFMAKEAEKLEANPELYLDELLKQPADKAEVEMKSLEAKLSEAHTRLARLEVEQANLDKALLDGLPFPKYAELNGQLAGQRNEAEMSMFLAEEHFKQAAQGTQARSDLARSLQTTLEKWHSFASQLRDKNYSDWPKENVMELKITLRQIFKVIRIWRVGEESNDIKIEFHWKE